MSCSCRSFSFFGRLAAVLVLTLSTVCGIATARAQGVAGPRVVRASASRVMTLEPLSIEERAAQSLLKDPKNSQEVPEGFREFGTARAGEVVETKSLTLRFAAAAALTKIEGTPDFKVEQGGSCVEGYSYAANQTCTLLVRFTPQGPGRRVGKLAVTNSADVSPLFVGLGGYGSAPTISFTPSIISTVPGTFVSNEGILSGATNLAVDGGDGLYMADTGNNLLRYFGSSGTLQTIPYTYVTAPIGVGVDAFDTIYSTADNAPYLNIFNTFGGSLSYSGGSAACSYGTTCDLLSAPLDTPGAVATDAGGTVFFSVNQGAYRIVPSNAYSFGYGYIPLGDSYNSSSPGPLAVDANDAVYAFESYFTGSCFLSMNPYYYAANGLYTNEELVAGGRSCGFAGDGGQARNALIGTSVGQMVFDIAGNLYFTDTSNQRVRRIDEATGIITTIAGNGAAGYYGDGEPATLAALDNPTGVAVDSQGQVYVISSSSATGTAQVVRKVGTEGALNLGQVTLGSSSTAQTVTVANTGNSSLSFTHVGFSSGNTTDFVMDPNTTSCNFTVGLQSGSNCKIGFIFTPTVTGNRSAVLSMTDDTVTGLNTIQLTGAGYTSATLTPASFTFASTTLGSTSASQTATLTNTGKAILTISSIAFSGTGATSYADTTTCGTTLAIGANCTISVTFKPTTGTALPATLTLTDNAYPGRQTIALTGTGVAAVLSPTTLTFPATELGATSAAQTVKLTNTANVAIGFDSYYYQTDFPTTNNCPTSIAAGASCTITISYKPVELGARATSLTVNTSTGSVTVALNGTGVAAILSPTSLTFPSTAVGSTSASQTVKLTNTATTALGFDSYYYPTDFPTTDNCPASIAAGGSCTITISFKPAAASARSTSLTIATSNGSVSVSLIGTGTAAAKMASKVTLTTAPTAMNTPWAVMVSAHVSGASAVMPAGSVQIWEGSHKWAESVLGDGAASFTLKGMSNGFHMLTAVYLGDGGDTGSRSAPLRVLIGGHLLSPIQPLRGITALRGVAEEPLERAER